MKSPKKTRGPQINGRIRKTEVFLRSMAAKIRARAEAQNLQRSRSEDGPAGQKLRDLSALCDRIATELREPELPLET